MTTPQGNEELGATSIARLGDAVKAAMATLDETDQRVATAIYRLMSLGEPVGLAAIADVAGITVDEVNSKLDSWPGVFRDKQGRVVGFWGQAIAKLNPEYRLVIDGSTTLPGAPWTRSSSRAS